MLRNIFYISSLKEVENLRNFNLHRIGEFVSVEGEDFNGHKKLVADFGDLYQACLFRTQCEKQNSIKQKAQIIAREISFSFANKTKYKIPALPLELFKQVLSELKSIRDLDKFIVRY